MIFELVRRAYHQNQLSRFQSVFGFVNEENLHNWVDFSDMEIESGKIWRVKSDSYYVKDAALLDSPGANEPGNDIEVVENLIDHAHIYWEGNSTSNPIFECLLEPKTEVIGFVKSIEF